MFSLARSAQSLSRSVVAQRCYSIKSQNIVWSEGVPRATRQKVFGQQGVTLWLTGLSGSGKSTIANALEEKLVQRGVNCYRLDGDNVRFGLNSNLGFSPEDRVENVRRVGEVAKLFADSCSVCMCSFISPYKADRDLVREKHAKDGVAFYEVYVHVPLDVAESRDPKGLYKKAREGKIPEFTGISAPYEEPEAPEVLIRTADTGIDQAADQLVEILIKDGLIPSK